MKKRKKTKSQGNPNPSPATRWKKGNKSTGGLKPGVVPKKILKEFTRLTVAECLTDHMKMTPEELRAVSEATDLPVIEVIAARALLRDRMEGEWENTERLLDRAIGKVPQHQMLSDANGAPLVPPQISFVPVISKDKQANEEGMGST